MIKDYMAIINLDENENDIRSLTTNRPIASMPKRLCPNTADTAS